MEKYPLKDLNRKLGNLSTLYQILVDNKGYYLPKWNSHACSQNYLLNVIRDEKTFKIIRNKITQPPMIKQTKSIEELMEMVEKILKERNQTLGFDVDKRPDKEWIINILHHLEPKNPIFFFEENILERTFPKGY